MTDTADLAADTAAFFAKKKTKKKKFKSFNANKIDASAVTASTHVDAPEISAENVTTSLGDLRGLGGTSAGAEDDQWADNGGGWGNKTNATTVTSAGDSKVTELLDMGALKAKRNEQDNVAERLRIEETKAKLARAKQGMANEAERLKAEKEFKVVKATGSKASGGGGLGGLSGMGGGGGKYVPSHMRSTGLASGASRFGSVRGAASMDGSGFQKPVDMASEELFPDLAAADEIIAEKEKREKEEKDRMATGGIAPAAAAPTQRKALNLVKPMERKPLNLATPPQKTEEVPEPKKEEETKPAAEATTAESPAPADATPAAVPAAEKPVEKKKVLKKKKKKDLSTFKPKS